ncbi:GNAT family N-acetyltransferase [Synechocystis salina]|uniref:GNAT family N-acetyltransferase n=1 Tax=Synechocystis salina LEGE 00031 TaxID=1828736 RepID=A0ABR9VQ20_9SYNC|nr:GNAT family N-acetyltransferase [Synechocystis salina]MBE9242786.1 GNAT family N-acetyltransferase [Synechocystis salina LEGE 00041]MBE9253450.1 GNAT family N-acetyltransferase [Synechocystis salina LEGE 00031]
MKIRLYQEVDQAALLTVWYRAAAIAHCFLPANYFQQERSDIVDLYLPMAETWVYEHQGEVVGFISLLGQTVGGFFVDPEMQDKGVGRSLMDHAVQLRGALNVEVFEQNEIGRRFYSRYGFVPVSSSHHNATGQPLILMKFVPRR